MRKITNMYRDKNIQQMLADQSEFRSPDSKSRRNAGYARRGGRNRKLGPKLSLEAIIPTSEDMQHRAGEMALGAAAEVIEVIPGQLDQPDLSTAPLMAVPGSEATT